MILVQLLQQRSFNPIGGVVAPPPPQGIEFQEPLVITYPGTYSGNYRSTNSNVPAIDIRTTGLVRIEDSIIQSAGHCINSMVAGANVEIVNCKGYGLTPSVAGRSKGKFFNSAGIANAVIENNYLESTNGILFQNYRGNKTLSNTIKVRYNKAKNIDNRTLAEIKGTIVTHFLQFNAVLDVPGIEISWNQILNEYGNSTCEDVINMFTGSGIQTSPILIHNNFIDGSYQHPSDTRTYSGGGIMIDSDIDAATGKPCAWIKAYGNQVIRTQNYGIAIAGGNNNEFYANRVICRNILSDGTKLRAMGNVGGYVINLASQNDTLFNNNKMYNNEIAYVQHNADGTSQLNNSNTPHASFRGNNSMSGVTVAQVTKDLEDAEYTLWAQKLLANSISIGPNF